MLLNKLMIIRLATYHDINALLAIFEHARIQMTQDGNPNQWGDGYPQKEQIEQDIQQNVCYVLIDSHTQDICGTFVFIIGEDPTYRIIEDGEWINDTLPYGTIHRIASNGQQKGIFRYVLDWCSTQCPNIRIDTHHANQRMIHLIEQTGFQRCGIIYVRNTSPRIAYQRLTSNN